jgi:hypothetical protein
MPVDPNANWVDREKYTRWWTEALMLSLKEAGHIYAYVKASFQQDRDDGIDYFIKFQPNGKIYRIQFKIRQSGYRDIPVVRDQPFYGIDRKNNPIDGPFEKGKNTIGRDYKGLIVKQKSDLYFVAVANGGLYTEVYVISTEKLRPLVLKLEEAWNNIREFVQYEGEDESCKNSDYKFRREFLTNQAMWKMKLKTCLWSPSTFNGQENHGIVFLLRNKSEAFWKTYFYIPEHHKQKSLMIDKDKAQQMAEDFAVYHKAEEEKKS